MNKYSVTLSETAEKQLNKLPDSTAMSEPTLNLDGLNDRYIQDVRDSFRLLNKNGNAVVISDHNELQGLNSELAIANVNVFSKNTEILNVIKKDNQYFIQLKLRTYHYNTNKTGGVTDVDDYFLSQICYKQFRNDYGIINIEPIDKVANLVVKLLTHIFSTDDLVIHGHEKFASKYHICATDKQIASSILSDLVLDAINEYDNLHISFAHDKMSIWTPELNINSTTAIMKVLETLSI